MVVIPRYPLESHVASFAEEGYLIWFCRSPERTEEPQCLIAGTAAQGTEPSQSSCASGAFPELVRFQCLSLLLLPLGHHKTVRHWGSRVYEETPTWRV